MQKYLLFQDTSSDQEDLTPRRGYFHPLTRKGRTTKIVPKGWSEDEEQKKKVGSA